jgi:hypothetical protein
MQWRLPFMGWRVTRMILHVAKLSSSEMHFMHFGHSAAFGVDPARSGLLDGQGGHGVCSA